MRLTCLKSASVCHHHCYIKKQPIMRPPNSPDTITDETRDFTVVNHDAGFIDTITDETRDSYDTFNTKFWDSIKLMNPCVFDVCQYLRVLRLSCLSCSIVVIIDVTSMQTDRQSIYGVCHEWLYGAIHGPMGDSGPKAQTHKAARKFHAIWCLSLRTRYLKRVCGINHDCLNQWCVSSSIMIVLINEWWIIAYQSSIISPWLQKT